jgi:hypothetical protein
MIVNNIFLISKISKTELKDIKGLNSINDSHVLMDIETFSQIKDLISTLLKSHKFDEFNKVKNYADLIRKILDD